MSKDLTLAARLTLDANRWTQGLGMADKGMKGFVANSKRGLESLRTAFGSVQGQLASLGVTVGATALIIKSAEMDKALTRTKQIAGASSEQIAALRKETFELAKVTGVATEELQKGFASLVAGGMSFDNARNSLVPMNVAMGVTHSNAESLSAAMKSASANMGLDFSDLKEATKFINEMATAADLGSAEVENLAQIYGALGAAPRAAGWDNARTMAFTEALSNSVPIDQLGTLIGTGTQLFTNKNYSKDFTKALGVEFYNKDGTQRDSLDVMSEAKARLDKSKTKEERDNLLFQATGKMDKQARDFVALLTGGDLLNTTKKFDANLRKGGDYLSAKLDDSLNNSISQASRLKETLKASADAFAQPINEAITGVTKKLLDKKKDGGLELSGGEILGGTAAAVAAMALARKIPGIGNLLGGGASLASGLAAGSALEKSGLATPVFVVGAAPGLFSGVGGSATDVTKMIPASLVARASLILGSSVSSLAMGGVAGIAALAGGALTALAGGYAFGTLINKVAIEGTSFGDKIGEGIARALAVVNFGDSRASIASQKKYEDTLRIEINSQGQAKLDSVTSSNHHRKFKVNTGRATTGLANSRSVL